MSLGIVKEFVLLSILPLEVVYVALVVIDRFELLLHQLEGEVGEEESFDER